ncbi:MAG: RNA polymerase sigma-54 factor, partial [Alistipes sp.]|nr:RNA polymerase sigma-54 factor [Alistipes sp.]
MAFIGQRQALVQQQKLSPQQIQMIKLLELPSALLEQRIKEEIEENIVLEEEQRTEEGDVPKEISMDEYLREDDTPAYKTRLNHFSKDDRPRNVQMSGGRSLQEYLTEQLGYRNLTADEHQIAQFIIGSIDSDGYLRRDMQSLSDDIAFTQGIEVSIEELERLLSIIQQMEPAGIGARDLRESLILQLDSQKTDTPQRRLARKILDQHFDEFVKKHYEKLLSRLGCTEEEFRSAVQEIQRLSPKPANLFTEESGDVSPY